MYVGGQAVTLGFSLTVPSGRETIISLYTHAHMSQHCLLIKVGHLANTVSIYYTVDIFPAKELNRTFVSLYFQGGFARCYEMLDLNSNKIYAGKIISKHRISKPHQRQKVNVLQIYSTLLDTTTGSVFNSQYLIQLNTRQLK